MQLLVCLQMAQESGGRSEREGIGKSNTKLLNRREFNGLCAALGSFVTSSGASAIDAATGVPSNGAGRTVKFRDGTVAPALGQGSAGLANGRHTQAEEEEAVRTGLSLGMTLIDTAESYGSEECDRPRDGWSARSRIPGLQSVGPSRGRKRHRARVRG